MDHIERIAALLRFYGDTDIDAETVLLRYGHEAECTGISVEDLIAIDEEIAFEK